jgi:hypothetical protein
LMKKKSLFLVMFFIARKQKVIWWRKSFFDCAKAKNDLFSWICFIRSWKKYLENNDYDHISFDMLVNKRPDYSENY